MSFHEINRSDVFKLTFLSFYCMCRSTFKVLVLGFGLSAQSLVRGSKFQGLVGSIEIQHFYNLESGSIGFASDLLLLFNFVQKSNSESLLKRVF